MTEKRTPYRVPLDPSIRALSHPRSPDLGVGAHDVPAAQREVAAAVAQRAFVAAGLHLEMPPEVWIDEEAWRRFVLLWGLIELSVSSRGTDFRVRTLGGATKPPLVEIDLRRPIGHYSWVGAFDSVLAAAFEDAGLPARDLDGPVAKYVRRVLRKSFEHCVDWNRLRRLIAKRLQLDPLAAALTRRVFEGEPLKVERFHWAASNQRELALVAIEHPGLLPFMRLMTHRDDGFVKGFDELLRERGITPGARAKLERWGYAPFDAAFEEIRTHDAYETVAQLGNAFDRIGTPAEPAAAFGALTARALQAGAPDWFLRAMWEEVCEVEQILDPEDPPIPGDYEDAVDWIATRPAVDRNQERAGWAWIVRQARAHRHATDAAACIEWDVPCGTRAIAGHAVVPLRCLRDLEDEAAAMRNCLDSMADDCREGRIAAFSIRKGGRRLACFTLARVPASEPFWQVLDVTGPRNLPAPEGARIAARLASSLLGRWEPHASSDQSGSAS